VPEPTPVVAKSVSLDRVSSAAIDKIKPRNTPHRAADNKKEVKPIRDVSSGKISLDMFSYDSFVSVLPFFSAAAMIFGALSLVLGKRFGIVLILGGVLSTLLPTVFSILFQ